MPKSSEFKASRLRFGIGEWHGVPLTSMTKDERQRRAQIQFLPKSERPGIHCPFQVEADFNKVGGVCSLRIYERSSVTGRVSTRMA